MENILYINTVFKLKVYRGRNLFWIVLVRRAMCFQVTYSTFTGTDLNAGVLLRGSCSQPIRIFDSGK